MYKLLFIPTIALMLINGCQPKAEKTPETVVNESNELAWMAGDWVLDQDSTVFNESWVIGEGGMLKGSSTVTKHNKELMKEDLRLLKMGDKWMYIARVEAYEPVLFTLTDSSDLKGQLTFVNEEHDYPQRISYALQQDSTLKATVSGKIHGSEMQDVFVFRKR